MTPRTIIFAGGGTGGHLFPGLAIADQTGRRDHEARMLFICSDRDIDAEILTAAGVHYRPIPARPLALRPRALASLAWNWGRCVRAGRAAIREQRADERLPIVVALGGFVAAPIAQAARAESAPLLLVNLDAVPGRTNRWIARFASSRLTSTPIKGADDRLWTSIPPIVRDSAVPSREPGDCRAALGLDPDRPTLFVTGASQGARTINHALGALIERAPELLRGWQVLHQTGAKDADAQGRPLADAYEQAQVPAVVTPFCADMATAWGAATLAIARCGAGNVAEVWAASVPTVFLPYPHHADQHQKANAQPLVDSGGAILLDDRIDPPTNARALEETLRPLLSAEARLSAMRSSLRALGPADGAARVAEAILATRPETV